MSPEFYNKWSHIIADVDKHAIPVEFIRKIIIKLDGRKRHTINVDKLIKQGMFVDMVEDLISRKLVEMDNDVVGVEFILNVESIAEAVEPQTGKLLNKL